MSFIDQTIGHMREILALCQMLGYSPYESSLAPIIVMVGAIRLIGQKVCVKTLMTLVNI